MLNAIVDVPDLDIKNGRVVSVTQAIGGYNLYRVQFNPKEGEINPSSLGLHENEVEIVDDSEVKELTEPEFALGDSVVVADPIGVKAIVTGIVHSNSGCVEYEVYYTTGRGIISHILPGPLLSKTGTAVEPGKDTGSMNRSVERRM